MFITPKPEIFFHLVKITKTGLEHNEFIRLISRKLRIKEIDIAYAGTKDAIAVTTQYISIKNCAEETIRKCLETLPQIQIHEVHKFNRHLAIGELEANRFKIRIDSEDDVEAVSNNVFYNYFGLQRFGHGEEVEAGILLLCGKFEEAIHALIPKESSLENELQKLPKTSFKFLLLKNHQKSKDAIFSWNQVSLTKRKFLLHATGSLLWNILCNKVETEDLDFIGSATGSILDLYLRQMAEIAPSIEFTKYLINERLDKIGMSLDNMNGTRKRTTKAEELKQEGNTLTFQLKKGSYATMFLREVSHGGIVG